MVSEWVRGHLLVVVGLVAAALRGVVGVGGAGHSRAGHAEVLTCFPAMVRLLFCDCLTFDAVTCQAGGHHITHRSATQSPVHCTPPTRLRVRLPILWAVHCVLLDGRITHSLVGNRHNGFFERNGLRQRAATTSCSNSKLSTLRASSLCPSSCK